MKIDRETWGKNKGKVSGCIEFENELGSVSLFLDHEKCEELFRVCADGILDAAKAAAEEMTCRVIEHKKLIEAKTEENNNG